AAHDALGLDEARCGGRVVRVPSVWPRAAPADQDFVRGEPGLDPRGLGKDRHSGGVPRFGPKRVYRPRSMHGFRPKTRDRRGGRRQFFAISWRSTRGRIPPWCRYPISVSLSTRARAENLTVRPSSATAVTSTC